MSTEWLEQIRKCAVEYGWKVDQALSQNGDLVIGIGGDEHGISYALKRTPKYWLNVHFWYSTTYKSDAVYSLRSTGEVGIFIALLRDTYAIRSRRRIGK
jgi:hypothetical protein